MNLDDMPVGQHNAMSIPEYAADEKPPAETIESAASLPLNERLVDKNTKVRFEAFGELLKLFNDVSDSDPIFCEHLSLFPKYVSDSHSGSQEKAIDCFLLLLSKSKNKPTDISGLITPLIEKCYTSAKTSVKTKATDSLLSLAQLQGAPAVINETILNCMTSKNAKVTIAAIRALTELLSNFGNSVYSIQTVLGPIVAQAQSTNSGLRTEAMNYFKEAYKWIKEGLFPAISGLKQSQQDELKAYCSTLPDCTAEPRLFANGKAAEVKMTDISTTAPLITQKPRKREAAAVKDLSKFDEDWCENLLATKKWSDKRDMLEEVLKVALDESAKLDSYQTIAQYLKKLLDNSNIVVVNLALRCLGTLAMQLKGQFSSFAKSVIYTVAQKCKDKKTLNEAEKCLELFANSFTASEILENVKEMLNDKSPLVRLHICMWIEKSLVPSMTKEDISALVPCLGKLTDDASNDVRDPALSCIAKMKATKDCDSLNKVIQEMIPQKQEKITQIVSKLTGKVEVEPMEIGIPEDTSKYRTVESIKAKEKKPVANKVATNASKANEEPENTDEELIQILSEKFPLEALEGLANTNWKEKQQALQTISQLIEARPELELRYTDALARILTIKLKNFKESNLVVLKEGVNILNIMASSYVISSKFANAIIVAGMVEKLADSKIAQAISELLLSVGDSVNPKEVVTLMIKHLSSAKNPNTIKASIGLLEKFLDEFTSMLVPVKAMIEFGKQCLGNSNIQVRNTATTLLCKIYAEMGDSIKSLITSDLKDPALKTLQYELTKITSEPKSTSEIKRKIKGDTEKEWMSKKASKYATMDLLLPRINIAPQITSKILSGLTNSGMKQRQEAKEALEKILTAANFRIQPAGLSPLFNALKSRMNEPCKNLAKGFIVLVGTLAAAMGPGAKQYSRMILQPLLYNLADKQTAIRAETLTALNKFAEAAGTESVANSGAALLEKDNPELRSGILGWIIKHKQGLEKVDMNPLIRGLVASMQDRSRDIRTMAEEVIGEIVPLVGHEVFMDAIKDLKPTVRETLKLVLDRYKVMIPIYCQNKEEPMEVSSIDVKTAPLLDQPMLAQTTIEPIIVANEKASRQVVIEEQKTCPPKASEQCISKSQIEERHKSIADILLSPLSSFEIVKIITEKLKTEPDLLISEASQVLRWISLKISISILNKPASEFLYSFFSLFSARGMSLTDADASVILPAICDKFSGCNELFSLICSGIYPPEKVVFYLTKPLEYSTAKTKLECLIAIKQIIIAQGKSAISQVEPKAFAKLLSEDDESVRNEATKILTELYKLLKESIWIQLSDITEHNKAMLKGIFDSVGSEASSIIRSLKKCSLKESAEAPTKVSSTQRKPSCIVKIESLEQCLEQLKYGEISNKIDALIYVGEKATFAMDGISDIIPVHCNEVIAAFTEVMKKLFDMGFDEVHLRFIKYFMNVINKICSCKLIVGNLNETELYNVIEQLLVKLLFEGLEHLGSNSEGEALMKCINSTILRLLENCQPTCVYCVLISLLRAYVFSDNQSNPFLSPATCTKFPGLIVKCLLKLTKVIEQLLPSINIGQLFLAIHEFLLAIPPQPHTASPNEEIASRIIKTIVNEVVKVKKEEVWEAYKEVQKHKSPDTHIERWIKVILKSLKPSATENGDMAKKLESHSEVLTECKNKLAAMQATGDIYERINQFKMRMLNMPKKLN